MIIALKDKDSVWIGVSAEKSYNGIHTNDIIHEDNLNMWRMEGAPDCIIASLHVGGIDLDRLRYTKDIGLSSELNQKNLIENVIPRIKDLFHECGMFDGKEGWQTLVIAKESRAFMISSTFECTEIEDFDIYGKRDAENVAYGAMLAYNNLPPAERIAEAVRVVEKMRGAKHFPVVVMNTKEKDRIVIYE